MVDPPPSTQNRSLHLHPQTCEACADFSTNYVTGLEIPIQSIRSSEQIRDGIDALHQPFDPVAAYHHALAILRELQGRGIPPSSIAIDCTGGTAPMSIGAHQAAQKAQVASIYVIGQETNHWINHPERREAGHAIYLSRIPTDPTSSIPTPSHPKIDKTPN